jgi:hypothetical protein
MIKTHPGASLREIARVAHVSLGTAQDVRKRMRDGLPPIPHEPPETPDARREDRHRSLDSVVKRLTGDPSIRGTAAGRELLQRLRAGVMSPEERATMLGAVPAHRTASVAEAARECAEVWSRIAAEIEGRTSGS